MAELGWVGMIFPEAYGGMDSSLTDLGVIWQEMGWGAVPSPLLSSAVLCGLTILGGGTEQQKEQLLPAIAQGEQILALALTEFDYGWGPESVHLAASSRDGKFVLNGKKFYVPDAHIANQLLCVARTKESQNPEEGISLFLVDKDSPGLSCNALTGFAGEKINEVVFDSVEVDRSAVIGELNGGWPVLKPAIEKATAVLCAYMVGGCQRVLELTVEYARTRIQFGVPIGTFQRVQDHVIEILNALDSARWTAYEALWKLDERKPDATKSAVLAKIVASEGFHGACTSSHEVHAGVGVDRTYPLYLYTKKSRSFHDYLGSPVYLRNRMAELLCD
jgi:alkylation response protein AidB-like acyl-CoA dehydrogenase